MVGMRVIKQHACKDLESGVSHQVADHSPLGPLCIVAGCVSVCFFSKLEKKPESHHCEPVRNLASHCSNFA